MSMFRKKDEALGGNFKVKELKVFGSRENLYFNVKKYRKVYDETECTYLYAELSLYNKLFDEAEWTTAVRYVCTNVSDKKVLCDFNKELKIAKEDNIIYVREGWGTPEPGWWKKGSYQWEVFVDGKSVGIAPFYIVDAGLPTVGNNPYFTIKQVRLFESQRMGLAVEERQYLRAFSSKNTRYLNAELILENMLALNNDFPLELHFNYYNDSGQLKAVTSYFTHIKDGRKEHSLDSGYGSDSGGYWYQDNYTLEVIFMDTLIAVIPFEVGEEDEAQEGLHPFSISNDAPPTETPNSAKKLTFEEAKKELDSLIGLKEVKDQINEMASYLQFLKVRKEKGFEENQKFNLHTLFVGNPGTGKTTVVKLLGQIYHSLDLLSHGKVLEVGRADLVGEFIGQTAPKTKKAIDKARGGILFIDEAYSLTNRGDDAKDFGKECIEVLLKELSDGIGDLAIVFAGYPKEMQHFLNSNPGMASRVRQTVYFADYSPDELMQIAKFAAEKSGVELNEEAQTFLHNKVVEIYRNRNENFGNARLINGIIEEAKQNMAIRLMLAHADLKQLDKNELAIITQRDVAKAFKENSKNQVLLPVDDALLHDSLTQLHALNGLENIKREVDEMVKLVRYYREIGKDVKKSFSLHTVFKGNPGTGKTTVARIIVQIYKALGILERGHLVECDRKNLVAGFVGQTAIKTNEQIQKAMGGGLFIDEAYALAHGTDNDFGKESIETLLKAMEDHRGEFVVIAAGYPKEMQKFLESNPGLMSRFDKQFDFPDYTTEELSDIAKTMFRNEELFLKPDAEEYLKQSIERMIENKHKYFGNARTIRKIVQEAIRKQNLRMAHTPSMNRTDEYIHAIILDDLKNFDMMENETRKGIGFRRE